MSGKGSVQGASEAALARIKATVAWAPLVPMLVQRAPDQVVACAGEESTEAEYQARRQSVNVSSVNILHVACLCR